jgi:hypothetical protein
MEFPKLCTPALIYFILAVISVLGLISQGVMAFTLIIKVIFMLLWTWLLNFFCNKGYGVVSWILVLLPFIFILGVVASTYEVLRQQQSNQPNQQKQPS